MKIIAVIASAIAAGGGFDQALNAISQMKRISKKRFEFEVFTTHEENRPYLERLGVEYTVFAYSIIDRLMARIGMNAWWQSLQSRVKYIGPLEKKLLSHQCDLVYFVTPGGVSAALQTLNHIATVWDLCHRDTPEFPEVRDFNTFHIRERHFKNNLGPALLVLTDSEQLADRASNRYGVDRDRFLPMPFGPSPLIEQTQANDKAVVLEKYVLEEGYLYYPAQFWAHKNHIRILQAFLLLRQEKNWTPTVVFTGKDYGNLSHVKAFAEKNELSRQVKVLGFVPSEDIRGLYKGALAVVMPTYFGPTNLPPLEAWSLGTPLIYSAHLAEQTGDAALLVNPDDAEELAHAMYRCTDAKVRNRLIRAGKKRFAAVVEKRRIAEKQLVRDLEIFAARRMCWE